MKPLEHGLSWPADAAEPVSPVGGGGEGNAQRGSRGDRIRRVFTKLKNSVIQHLSWIAGIHGAPEEKQCCATGVPVSGGGGMGPRQPVACTVHVTTDHCKALQNENHFRKPRLASIPNSLGWPFKENFGGRQAP